MQFGLHLLFVLLLFILPGCGGKHAPQSSGASSAEVGGPITFVNNGALTYDPSTVINMARFSETHPRVQLEVVEESDILARLATLFAGGEEDFDITEPSAVNVPQFISIGALMPLDDLFPPAEMARYPEGTLNEVTGKDGHIYGKPH